MGTVIYSANLLWAFLSPLGSILFTSAIGVFALIAAFRQRKQGRGVQIILGICGVFLLAFSLITVNQMVSSFLSGTETITMHVDDKSIGRGNCGNGSTCTHYDLAATAGQVSYDLRVNPQAYNAVHSNTCYRMTFYKYKPFMSAIPDTDLYHRIEVITRIEIADPAACS
jgi:hypothetical protein